MPACKLLALCCTPARFTQAVHPGLCKIVARSPCQEPCQARSTPVVLIYMRLHPAGVVYNAQRINTYLREHWKAFARQPYFDEQGIFISAVVSAPLLLIMLIQLVH